MKTPWFMLYQAGDKLGGWLDTVGPSSFGFGRLVGIFYFIVLFMFMEGVAALVHLIASVPNWTPISISISTHFCTSSWERSWFICSDASFGIPSGILRSMEKRPGIETRFRWRSSGGGRAGASRANSAPEVVTALDTRAVFDLL